METTALVIDRAPVEEALSWPDRAQAVTIDTPIAYAAAAELLKGIKGLRQRITDTFSPHVQRAFDAHRALVAEQRTAEDPLSQAERIIKDKLVAYDREQERIRLEEQRRLQEQARKDEEARRLAEAAAMETEAQTTGDVLLQAEAEAMIAEPVVAPIVAVERTVPKVAGISYRETWKGELVDLGALVRHVATHPEHLNLIQANAVAINGLARSLKGAMKIPGVRATCTRDVAAGGVR